MELLAPAKNIDVARAAIQAGADAIYIGAPLFGARQAAGNSIEDIRRLTDYAHPYGVKVLVTVNTLMDDQERREAAKMAWQLYEAGVDALIVQDLRLLREDLPPIRLHASTQCDNRTAEQVVALQRMGFKRAVLARELTIDEIRAIRRATLEDNSHEPIELEVFVHGAACVSYSGKCFISERLMNRSANRGACAQMCRMAYDILDRNGQELRDDEGREMHQRYALSLKDIDRAAYLSELREAGVHTLKIEGRLKDAEYVTNIVAYYRQRLDEIEGARADRQIKYDFTPDPVKTFHRGSSPYFLHGRTSSMANLDSPKSTGEQVGVVTSARDRAIRLQLLPGVTLHNGDGLCFGDQGFLINTVQELPKGGALLTTFRTIQVPVGTMLSRNYDISFIPTLQATRRIPVVIRMELTEEGFRLTMRSTNADAPWQVSRSFHEPHEIAAQAERARATQRTQLSKLGDSAYVAVDIELPEQAYFVPIGTLNAWRRELIKAAAEAQQALTTRQDEPQLRISDQELPSYDFTGEPLMRCKYCLLHELGHCRKQPTRYAPDDEPKYLRLSNGTTLAMLFDCKQCEMTIHPADKR